MDDLIEAAQKLLSPLIVLLCFTLVLYGMVTTQVYSYWLRYDKDKPALRYFVLLIWILETIHSGLCIHILHWTFIDNLGTVEKVFTIGWDTGASMLFEVIVPVLVQGFYIYRISTLSENRAMVIAPSIALFLRCGVSLTTISFLFVVHDWSDWVSLRYIKITLNTGLAMSSCVDISITCLLIYLFRKKQAMSMLKRTRRVVQRLMIYTVNTGAITTLCGLAAIVMFNLDKSTLLFGGMLQNLSKLYANCLLAMLNAREHLKEELAGDSGLNSIPLQIKTPQTLGSRTTHEGENGGIHIAIRTEVSKDNNWPLESDDATSDPTKLAPLP